ncbi:MAG TPA: N-acetylmuramoyl-L-alanine amidase [Burkholderiales bacterium]|nr:N-acetylmuramoyl-L-alanine amidase [Burkholderiales bacterium]
MSACTSLPPSAPRQFRPALPVEQRASPNFDSRRPQVVIIHHTTNDDAHTALSTLTDPARKVSSHYLIARDGRIIQLVDERQRAWHAGHSWWGGYADLNSSSIGIELDNNGREPFAEPLIISLLALLRDIKQRLDIPAANFIGHGDVAPGRKVDPSTFFPWQRLAAEGYGLWCDPPFPPAPPYLDTAVLLQALGYNVWNLDAAVGAFKRHFVPEDPSLEMTEKDRSVLYCLVLQKQGPGEQRANHRGV